jgi:hypothetical protein
MVVWQDLMEVGRRIEEGEIDVMQSSAPIEAQDEKAIASINDETGEAFDAEVGHIDSMPVQLGLISIWCQQHIDKYTSMRSPPNSLTDYQKCTSFFYACLCFGLVCPAGAHPPF